MFKVEWAMSIPLFFGRDKFFGGAIILCLIAGIMAPRSLSFLPGVMGVLLAGYLFLSSRTLPAFRISDLFFITIIPLLATLSALWSADASYALEKAGKIFCVLAPGILFIAALRRVDFSLRLPFILCLLVGAGGFLIGIDYLTGLHGAGYVTGVSPDTAGLENKYNRSLVVLSFAFLPCAVMFWRSAGIERIQKQAVLGFMAAGFLLALSQTSSQTAQISFAVSIAFFVLFPVRKWAAWAIISVLIGILILSAPFAIEKVRGFFPEQIHGRSFLTEASIPHRLEVWHFAATEILKKPVAGHGVDSMRFMTADTYMTYMNSNHVLHPHNAVMQVWVEFGVIGALLLTGFAGFLLREISRAPAYIRPLWMTAFMGALCASVTGYGLWQGWQLGLFVFLAGLCTVAVKYQPSESA